MSPLPKHVIRTDSGLIYGLIIALLTLSLLVLGVYCWQQYQQLRAQEQQYGIIKKSQSEQQKKSQKQIEKIGSQQQQLSEKNAAAREKTQALTIQETVNAQLENQLTILQDKLFSMEKKLSFYQTVSHDKDSKGIHIHQFQLFIDDTDQPKQLRYRLILTQDQRIKSPITGSVTLQIPNAEPIILAESSLKLRYVQVIEGYFTLGKDTSPNKITVILAPKDKEKQLQVFDWQITKHLE